MDRTAVGQSHCGAIRLFGVTDVAAVLRNQEVGRRAGAHGDRSRRLVCDVLSFALEVNERNRCFSPKKCDGGIAVNRARRRRRTRDGENHAMLAGLRGERRSRLDIECCWRAGRRDRLGWSRGGRRGSGAVGPRRACLHLSGRSAGRDNEHRGSGDTDARKAGRRKTLKEHLQSPTPREECSPMTRQPPLRLRSNFSRNQRHRQR